ncbi:hypothetical protein [Stakelama saccharophila]|uniref:Uncharacterized protein n=1 Tax=Stakelama saccharophila TaxID=3075605 RepID=A0ABZ0B939_9SPHN|nr:hypothetical protein [Stakelama sp. W311]WNO53909.1 hypothetical protein RPR59_01215 [Stakelama sp. W311]
MASFGLDMDEIVDLGTEVATAGALQQMGDGDEVFEMIVGVAVVVYQSSY